MRPYGTYPVKSYWMPEQSICFTAPEGGKLEAESKCYGDRDEMWIHQYRHDGTLTHSINAKYTEAIAWQEAPHAH